MKSFLIKIYLFALIGLMLIQIPKKFVSYYWANDYFKIKYEYYQQHSSDYNTVFIGSSRIYRHIIPKIIDSNLTDYRISCFNLGAPGTFNPQTYYLLENFLETVNDSLKYVFIELQPINFIVTKNIAATKNYYWHNPEYWKFAMRYIIASEFPLKIKVYLGYSYTASLLTNFLHTPDYKTLTGSPDEITQHWLGPDKKGQFSLDDQLLVSGTDTSFRVRRNQFLADTTVMQSRIKASINDFSLHHYESYLNRVHLKKIKELIVKAEKKHIRLIFLISPLEFDYKQQLAIKEQLPEINIVEIADYHKYPDLYYTSMLFDVGHLNQKGAEKFSFYLAQEMKRVLDSKK